ncbi:LolA-like putative outer membrane lipoprotein chaperone [Porphyromonas gulae]|uniref:LolA family protein n=1 Tax=Porphyromonas gulae TaxID=111105 RepID=UPI0026EB58AF|nr:LolA-like putative outer membrane lipoprotein chaperone [Porphyromonas gulae]
MKTSLHRVRMFRILFLLLFIPAMALSQRSAQGELQAAAKHLANPDGTRIDFQAETIAPNDMGSSPLSSGSLILKGNQFRLGFGSITAVFDGKKTLSYYDASENTLNISHPTNAELAMINPLIILTRSEAGYRTAMLPPTKGGNVIGLTPKTANGIKRIELQVSTQGSRPTGAVIILEDGTRIVTKITGISPTKASSELFRLAQKDYPNVEVIDLR